METKTILVVEDDDSIRRGILDALEFAGYATLEAARGDRGRELAVQGSCDLVLLDLILPHGDGLEILRAIRDVQETLPVIILTARGEESDRVRGLRLGADDYVVKPFSVKELLARIEAVLRRSPERPTAVREVSLPSGVADLDRCEVRFEGGDRSELSDRETRLLRYLASHSGRAVSREELLTRIWGLDPRGVTTRTIDMHVARLREKLRDGQGGAAILLTVRGKGYMLARGPGEEA